MRVPAHSVELAIGGQVPLDVRSRVLRALKPRKTADLRHGAQSRHLRKDTLPSCKAGTQIRSVNTVRPAALPALPAWLCWKREPWCAWLGNCVPIFPDPRGCSVIILIVRYAGVSLYSVRQFPQNLLTVFVSAAAFGVEPGQPLNFVSLGREEFLSDWMSHLTRWEAFGSDQREFRLFCFFFFFLSEFDSPKAHNVKKKT